jgi:hypothetical protein
MVMSFADLFSDLTSTLRAARRLQTSYPNENAFECAVWDVLFKRCAARFGRPHVPDILLCSHKSLNLRGRSAEAFRRFLHCPKGPDQWILGSRKRVDMVVKHPSGRTIGIEVECLTQQKPADALIIGVGQAVLALGQRDRTILVAHCGEAASAKVETLRTIARHVSTSRFQIVLRP